MKHITLSSVLFSKFIFTMSGSVSVIFVYNVIFFHKNKRRKDLLMHTIHYLSYMVSGT